MLKIATLMKRRAGLSVVLLVGWLGIALSKFNRWSQRLGTPNQHNSIVPRDFSSAGSASCESRSGATTLSAKSASSSARSISRTGA